MKKNIQSNYHSLCKAIVRGSEKTIATALYKSPAQTHIVKHICQDLEKECKFMSSRKNVQDSPFHSHNIDQFSLEAISVYLQDHCPLLYMLLSQCTKFMGAKTSALTSNKRRQLAAVTIAASVLINGRNPTQNALQCIIAIILHAGHAHKMVSGSLETKMYFL